MNDQTTQPFVTPMSVIAAVPNAEITCMYCQKIAQNCDGQRNLREIAQRVHLPWLVCVKLVERAITNQWLLLSSSDHQARHIPENFWIELKEALGQLNATEQLMGRANRMLGYAPEELPAQQLCDYLIALELAAPDPQRLELIPLLNQLRLKYAI